MARGDAKVDVGKSERVSDRELEGAFTLVEGRDG